MIGFEVELNVPTFEARFGTSGDGAIYSFLFCGYADTKIAVGKNNLFKIKPDIAAFADHGKRLLLPLSAFLPIKKTIEAKSDKDATEKVRITKMEYETFASDETAADSNEKYSEAATAIKDHAGQFAPQAKDKILKAPAPAEGMYAGVPVKEIEHWITVGEKHEHPEARAKAKQLRERLVNMQDSVLPEFAIQATAGIFPSVIPRLFENDQKTLDRPFEPQLKKAWQTAYPLICKSVAEVMNDETFSKHEWVQANLKDDVRRQAFKGHLYLLCSYLVGDTLSQTELFKNMSVKNAVPYHAKLNLGYFYKALPGGGSKAPPVELAKSIAEKLTAQEYVGPEFWSANGLPPCNDQNQSSDRQERLIYGSPVNFVSNAITGKPVRTFINQRGQEKIQGEHDEPDSAPLSKHGERGVQLEFRRLGAEGVSLDELQTAFMNVVSEVRKLNGAYAS